MAGIVNTKFPPLNLVSREEWGAAPAAVELQDLRKPCMTVRFWKYTDTSSCFTKEECARLVRDIQQRHIEQGLGDIRYNFLIGEDGNAYEGRGFDKMPPEDIMLPEIVGRYIEIALIGNHRGTPRCHDIYHVAYQISEEAVKRGTIDFDARLMSED